MDIEELYDRIYRYCYFKLSKRETAEDVTQETFLRCCAQGKPYDIRYLYTIARNLCIDVYREHKHEPLTEEIQQNDMEDDMLTNIALKSALAQLSEPDQELVLLRYVNEVPIGVIGELLGISRFAVRRKTNRILKQLRELLGKEDFS